MSTINSSRVERYDAVRRHINPILRRLFGLELVRITQTETGRTIGIGIRLAH